MNRNRIGLTQIFALTFIWMCSAGVVFAQPGLLPIDDFDGGIQNRLGGYRNTFEQAPSTADAMRVGNSRYGRDGLGLRLKVDRKAAGFCGYWIHFFDMNAPSRRFVDASTYKFLSFWVMGSVGGENFTVKLADERWIGKEDAVAIGSVDEFLVGGVTSEWREVLVPLDRDSGLNLERLGGLTFDFDVPGQTTVFIDNVSLKSSRDVPNQPAAELGFPTVAKQNAAPAQYPRALWLWSTESVLTDPAAADALFKFCAEEGITQIWAQLLYEVRVQKTGVRITDTICLIRRESAYRRFLKRAHMAGVRIHALEGYPEHAQREYHHVSLAMVDAIIAFNRGQPSEEQFDGIHFDNEPHLLVGWHDPQRREQILFEYLTLNSECQRRVRAASNDLRFGVDIPFWLQHLDEHQREPIGAVTFNGRRQAASFHLLEMLDIVGVMNYRDVAQGADGMIAHGRDLLTHADRASRAKVFMGVETVSPGPSEVLFAVGRPRLDFEEAVRGNAREFALLSRLDGHRLHVFDDGKQVHVGIELSEANTIAQRIEIARVVSKIACAFGLEAAAEQESAIAAQERLFEKLSATAGWGDVKRMSVRDPDTGESHLLVKANATMQRKLTFADENRTRFWSQINVAEKYFSGHSSYAGIAVHHYDSFRDLLSPEPMLRKAAR